VLISVVVVELLTIKNATRREIRRSFTKAIPKNPQTHRREIFQRVSNQLLIGRMDRRPPIGQEFPGVSGSLLALVSAKIFCGAAD